jgi:hypothetical protein
MSAMRNFFKRIIEELFLPTRLDYTKPFSWGWRILIIVIFLLLVVLSLPPVVEYICSLLSIESKSWFTTNKDILKAWMNFISLTLEILIAVLLGEIVLTEGIAQRLRRLVADSQVKNQLALDIELKAEEIRLKNNVDEIYRLLREKSSIKDLFKKAARLYFLVKETIGFLYPGMRKFYTRVILLSLITSFPGGFYGLLAFFLFVLLSITKVVSFYLDSPLLIA